MVLSQTQALMTMFLVSFLWGSWMQVVKHTGKYPMYAFMSWLYVFSIIIVWGTIAVLHETTIPRGVWNEISGDVPRAVIVFICGGLYAIGMQLQLSVIGRVGLVLSSSITSTCMILSGIVSSAILGGVSENTSMGMVAAAAVILICATVICQYAGVLRDRDKGASRKESGVRAKDIITLICTSGILVPCYSVATSIGLATELRPNGFSSLTCMGLMSIGALLGTSIYTYIHLKKDGTQFFKPEVGLPKILLMALIAAFCHFGGNILQSFAAPVVSVVIASGIGYSNGMWSYLWGLLYGEFKGASKRTAMVLILGMCCYITGVVLMTLNAA